MSIGNGNILYPNSALGHEAYIGDSNLIAINVTIGARTKVLNRNLFGNSSTLSLGLSVGNDNNIGVGAVVISNVNDGESLLGNPARDSVQVIKELIKNNRPCILTSAFVKSFKESFITFYKDSTGRAGTDFSRGVNISGSIVPVDFATARIEEAIVPTMGGGKGAPVYCGCNVFSGWKTEIVISCPKVVFPLDTLVQIVATSGKYIGIGTQRMNGYGRYHISNATIIGG